MKNIVQKIIAVVALVIGVSQLDAMAGYTGTFKFDVKKPVKSLTLQWIDKQGNVVQTDIVAQGNSKTYKFSNMSKDVSFPKGQPTAVKLTFDGTQSLRFDVPYLILGDQTFTVGPKKGSVWSLVYSAPRKDAEVLFAQTAKGKFTNFYRQKLDTQLMATAKGKSFDKLTRPELELLQKVRAQRAGETLRGPWAAKTAAQIAARIEELTPKLRPGMAY